MGLLSRITAEENNSSAVHVNEKRPGLLAHSKQIASLIPALSFKKFALKHRFEHAALLKLTENGFIISKCTGIDAETVIRSVSSKDFWQGTLKNASGWNNIPKDSTDFINFCQFFSGETLDQITALHILRISAELILITADYGTYREITGNTETIKSEILKLTDKKTEKIPDDDKMQQAFENGICAKLLIICIENAISAVLENRLRTSLLYETAFNSIFTEIAESAADAFSAPNICIAAGKGKMKAALFARQPDFELIQAHLSNLFSAVLGKERCISVLLTDEGNAETPEDVKKFIAKG